MITHTCTCDVDEQSDYPEDTIYTSGCVTSCPADEPTELKYEYDVEDDNHNGRTIQGFSSGAFSKMYDCSIGCPYHTYKMYYDYYGDFDYADKWVSAALDNENYGDHAVFKDQEEVVRKEGVKKGTAY